MVAASAEEIRLLLCYELKWMLRAVARFEQVTSDARDAGVRSDASVTSDVVALQDSALLHARNLVEFAGASSEPKVSKVQWALSDILGTHRRKVPGNLSRFLNNWVVRLGDSQTTDPKWPKDIAGNLIDGDDDQRLSKVTEVVFKLLAPKHRTTTLETDEGIAYVELLDRAHEYFGERTPEAFDRLTCSGDPMPAPGARARRGRA